MSLTNNSLTKMRGQTSLSCVTDGIRRGYRGDGGSECLGLASGPRLSLVRLGDRLVRALASSTGVVDRGSSMNNWSSVYSSVDNWSSVDNRGSVNNRGIGILSLTVIGDSSDVSVDGVGGVANMLGAAVREVDTVRTFGTASSVTGLGSIEVGGGVVVSDGVVVCVGGDLVRVNLSSMSYNRGVVGRGSVDYRSSVNNWGGMHNRGNSMSNSVSSNKSMSYKSVSCDNTMTGSMESVRRVMYGSYSGSEGFGLSVCSVFSLERLGDGLVRDLAGTNSYESMSSNKAMVSSNEELRSSCGSCHQAGDVQEDLHPVGLGGIV